MLDNLRRMGRTWFGKVLGAFLLVGLAGFGISNVLLDFGANNIASVGEVDISVTEFQRAYNDDLNAVARQIGRVPSSAEAVAMGIPSGTLRRLVSEAAVNLFGTKMGIGVSDERLSRLLREDPTFAGTLGQFDPESFSQVLQRSGFTESEYFNLQARAARRQQVTAGLFAGTAVPAAAKELLNGFSSDTRTIDYFVMNALSIPSVAEPTEAELAAYLAENQAQFRTDEERTVDLVVLTLDTLAAAEEITDAEIAEEFERTRDSRVQVEKRTIVQAPLTTPESRALFEAGLAAGRTFDELVAEAGVTVTELGTLTRAEVTDAALATAAFGLEAGSFTIIPGIGGQRAVAVTTIESGGEATLEEASEDIRRSLAIARARDQYLDVLDQVEELRAAFQPLTEIAERFDLPVQQVALTEAGAALESVPQIAPENRQRVVSAVFAASEDRLSPTIAISANNNIWFDLKGIQPARDQTLDEVRDEVAATLIEQRTDEALKLAVDDAVARIKAGEPLADLAGSANQFALTSQPLTRSGDGTPVLDQTVASEVFGGGPGHVGSSVNGDGDYVVFEVTEITPAAEEAPEATAYLEETTRLSLYGDFVTGIRDDAGVRENQQTLMQLLALDATGQ